MTHRVRSACKVLPLLLVLAAGGCGQDVSPTAAPLQATGTTLCFADYQKCINPIFNNTIQGQNGAVSCTQGSGCHLAPNGSGGQFQIDPAAQNDTPEMQNNFNTALKFVNLNDPPASLLLEKPTATGRTAGVGHSGGNIFPNDADACHVAIETWISNQVDDPNAASCGQCTAPSLASCGY